ncbi:MFS transporter [Rhodovulum sp. DZ06]|uniref:MFS transporter n=1 Tax=Rhodovulum sp. DZ06 TaxID=3425126 RepID=UPI003D3316F2
MTPKARALAVLFTAEIAAMALWFAAAAVLPDMLREAPMSPARQAALSAGVQLGFVIGALASAALGLADRYDPRRVFAACAWSAAVANAGLLWAAPGSDVAIALRVAVGALLAGVYPVGMKIAVGWSVKDRGFIVGALVGALTLGSALPHAVRLAGGADWRAGLLAASALAAAAGALIFAARLGPHHARAATLSLRAMTEAWTNRRVRLAIAGYLGHMWELYSFWAWIGVAAGASAAASNWDGGDWFGPLTAFCAIAAGAPACVLAGRAADRLGKAEVAAGAMVLSMACAIFTALAFGGPPWLFFACALAWGVTVIPDSAQFSALVADAAPPERAGSLMTLQTALGFALTAGTVQAAPVMAAAVGWSWTLAAMGLGPVAGIAAMLRLRAMGPILR